jgi:HlyD family secretion protein
MKRRRIVAVLLLILVGSAVWFFLRRETRPDNGIVNLYGNVDIREVNLGFQVAGRITAMPFEEGDLVKAGQIIARLDPLPFQQSLSQNQAQLSAQSANLAKLLAGTRKEEIAQDRANVAERQTDLANAEALLAKQQAAVQSGAVSRQDYQNALSQRNAAAARLQAAQQALAEALNGPRKQDIQAAQANTKAAQAVMAQAKTQLSYTALTAPSDGIVETRVREPGAVVNPGESVYTLALKTPKWIQAYLEEPDLGRVKAGLKVQIFTDTQPNQPFEGQVGYIAPVAEFTPKNVETQNLRTALVYPMRVIVKDPENRLRQGMPVTLKIDTGISRKVPRKTAGPFSHD